MNKVAVYGSLRQRMGNHRLLTNSTFLGTTVVEGWDMYDLGAFPTIVHGELPLTAEVYEVTDSVFASLDRLEGFPSFYDRSSIPTEYGQAWIYHFHEAPNAPQVYSGDWVAYRSQQGY